MQVKQKLQKPRNFTGTNCENIVSYWDEKEGKGLIVNVIKGGSYETKQY